MPNRDEWILTISIGNAPPYSVPLDGYTGDVVTVGRAPDCDIVINSPLVSKRHGHFCRRGDGYVFIIPTPTANITTHNHHPLPQGEERPLREHDRIHIDTHTRDHTSGVMMYILRQARDGQGQWTPHPIVKDTFRIGRAPDCDIVVNHVSVSRYHAVVTRSAQGYVLADHDSTNGLLVNDSILTSPHLLRDRDTVFIGDTLMTFADGCLYTQRALGNLAILAEGLTRDVQKRGKREKQRILDDVSLSIESGELVAIIGGSGAGKSTLLNAVSGYVRATAGNVRFYGQDLYRNYEVLKRQIGYVPQQDIVHNNLTMAQMLHYAAKLRMPKDTADQEIDARVDAVLEVVALSAHREKMIANLSGGQKKRASIAVELLSDPQLFFLDEPTSGLDPYTEQSLMHTLKQLAAQGKTVMLVTHSPLHLNLCDRLVVMGYGGRLCFQGTPTDALQFFGTDNFVDIYQRVEQDCETWADRFGSRNAAAPENLRQEEKPAPQQKARRRQISILSQWSILWRRYAAILLNDKKNLLLMVVLQPLLMAWLVQIVSDQELFRQYTATKQIMFALTCVSVWMGLFSAIREICKESAILRREFMTNVSLISYLASKLFVLLILCVLQSVLLVLAFSLLAKAPVRALLLPPLMEMICNVFLTAFASACMGLFFSALFGSAPDRVMTIAPLLLIPQLLFGGVMFKLEGVMRAIAPFIISYWGVNALCISAGVLDLPMAEVAIKSGEFSGMKYTPPTTYDSYFLNTAENLLHTWGMLLLYAAVMGVLCYIALHYLVKKEVR